MLLVASLVAVLVELPETESMRDWRPALEGAGLEPDQPGAQGEGVVISAGPDNWTVAVRDTSGVVHRVTVAPPTSPGDREDIAWLAASLRRPMTTGGAKAIPPPAAVEPVVQPAVVRPPPRPQPEPEPVEVVEVVLVPEPAVGPPEPQPLRSMPVLQVGLTDTLALQLGLAAERGPWMLGATLRSPEQARGLEASFRTVGLQVGHLTATGPLRLGPLVGLEARRWHAEPISHWALIPVMGGQLGLGWEVGPVVVEPRLLIAVDLRPTRVLLGQSDAVQPRLRGGFTVALSPGP